MKKILTTISIILIAVLISGSRSIPSGSYLLGKLNLKTVIENNINSPSPDEVKEFKVKFGQTLTIEMKTGGDIQIEGWEKELLKADVKVTGEDADNVEINFEETSSGIKITSECNKKKRNCDCNVKAKVMVPNKFNVDFETMGGDVKIQKVEGEIDGTTMGGDITFKDLKGNLAITTMGGDIDLTDSEVDGNIKTMGGDILVENVVGDVNAKSRGGDIRQKNVKRKSGSSTGDEVNVTTMGGDLEIDEAGNGAKLKTMGGNIKANYVAKFLTAKTMGGDIEVKAIDGWVTATTMGGDVDVKMVGDPDNGKRDVTLTSMGGDIKLSVPAGLSMNIDIEIAYTKGHEDDVKIISDFDIGEERSTEWIRKNGSKRKYLYGKGLIGGGKNTIKIKTINGKVYLNKN